MANSRALRLMLAVLSCLSGTGSAMVVAPTSTSGPSGLSRWLINTALASPLYKAVLVPQAKATMVKTAEKNGVPWTDALAWLEARGPWELPDPEQEGVTVPDYYREPFHAYESGNLCWEAALEGEIASRAVGARNFPEAGADGELAFRGAFDEALTSLGAVVPEGGAMVDLGCSSGISTRRLAANWPGAASVLGLDLSPHFLAVGRRLTALGRAEEAAGDAGGGWRWINDWRGYTDARVELRLADIGATGLPSGSVDVVSLSMVIHELPPAATRQVATEALRLLRPGGQLWITEMDFQTPAFMKLRANPLLFSLLRSTEPYLDVYADYMPTLPAELSELGFSTVRLAAATGRHFALVATKPEEGDTAPRVVEDRRSETAKADTHLKTWEAKKEAGR
mmetsp:Transcript_30681/g.72416  ORF Transcript_30681/g.72416 Transcript_30681/m.72416 type:complete len:396 (-) Transcript_30681:7-1194(-)